MQKNEVKIALIDERHYRFDFYYEPESWWTDRNIQCKRFAYEDFRPWKLLLRLMAEQVNYVVIVQLSNKNLILTSILRLIGIRTIFFQHGLFLYPIEAKFYAKLLKPSPFAILSLSQFDSRQLANAIGVPEHCLVIQHYDCLELRGEANRLQQIAYVGQVNFPSQFDESNSYYDYKAENYGYDAEKILLELFEYLGSRNDMEVLIKKHPADKSTLMDSFIQKYENFRLIDTVEDMSSCRICLGHYSTLMVAFIQTGIPTISIPSGIMKCDIAIDIRRYGSGTYKCTSAKEAISIVQTLFESPLPETGQRVERTLTVSEVIVQLLQQTQTKNDAATGPR